MAGPAAADPRPSDASVPARPEPRRRDRRRERRCRCRDAARARRRPPWRDRSSRPTAARSRSWPPACGPDLVVGDGDSLSAADLERLASGRGRAAPRSGREGRERHRAVPPRRGRGRRDADRRLRRARRRPAGARGREPAAARRPAPRRARDRRPPGPSRVQRIGGDGVAGVLRRRAVRRATTSRCSRSAGPVSGVRTSGLRYPLDAETLTVGPARGLSNELIGTDGADRHRRTDGSSSSSPHAAPWTPHRRKGRTPHDRIAITRPTAARRRGPRPGHRPHRPGRRDARRRGAHAAAPHPRLVASSPTPSSRPSRPSTARSSRSSTAATPARRSTRRS